MGPARAPAPPERTAGAHPSGEAARAPEPPGSPAAHGFMNARTPCASLAGGARAPISHPSRGSCPWERSR
jgi:hypothetical protein